MSTSLSVISQPRPSIEVRRAIASYQPAGPAVQRLLYGQPTSVLAEKLQDAHLQMARACSVEPNKRRTNEVLFASAVRAAVGNENVILRGIGFDRVDGETQRHLFGRAAASREARQATATLQGWLEARDAEFDIEDFATGLNNLAELAERSPAASLHFARVVSAIGSVQQQLLHSAGQVTTRVPPPHLVLGGLPIVAQEVGFPSPSFTAAQIAERRI